MTFEKFKKTIRPGSLLWFDNRFWTKSLIFVCDVTYYDDYVPWQKMNCFLVYNDKIDYKELRVDSSCTLWLSFIIMIC